jgi:hypothetical protein
MLRQQPDAADALRASGERRHLYHPRRALAPPRSASPCGGVFAAAACSAAGRACAEATAEAARALAEACDALDGLHLTLATSGGAGAGLGTLVLQELEARRSLARARVITLCDAFVAERGCCAQLELGRTSTLVHALFPSPTLGATPCACVRTAAASHAARLLLRAAAPPLEAYNAALCLRALTDSADVAREHAHTRAPAADALPCIHSHAFLARYRLDRSPSWTMAR